MLRFSYHQYQDMAHKLIEVNYSPQTTENIRDHAVTMPFNWIPAVIINQRVYGIETVADHNYSVLPLTIKGRSIELPHLPDEHIFSWRPGPKRRGKIRREHDEIIEHLLIYGGVK